MDVHVRSHCLRGIVRPIFKGIDATLRKYVYMQYITEHYRGPHCIERNYYRGFML